VLLQTRHGLKCSSMGKPNVPGVFFYGRYSGSMDGTPRCIEGGVQVYICQGYGKIVYGRHGMGVEFYDTNFQTVFDFITFDCLFDSMDISLKLANLRLSR
jgi:hypothetical protein